VRPHSNLGARDWIDSTGDEVFPLEAAGDRDDAGGKGRGLARLITLGYSVPAGFVISKSASVSSVTRLKNAGDAVGGNFAQQLQSAYRRLGVDAVAVRSSAEGEDSEVGSQAGIHASHLNVIGETALLESVEAVWADAAEAGEPIAIVVQAMLNPESAGVLFTRSPESPDQCRLGPGRCRCFRGALRRLLSRP
jgi:pyruvate,water dikinase